MAVHTWVDGEAITASKLNKLEKRKAYVEKTLDLTTCTAREVLEMVEDMPQIGDVKDIDEVPGGYRLYTFQENGYFYASSLDDYFIKVKEVEKE